MRKAIAARLGGAMMLTAAPAQDACEPMAPFAALDGKALRGDDPGSLF